jgi:hypothetical protein
MHAEHETKMTTWLYWRWDPGAFRGPGNQDTTSLVMLAMLAGHGAQNVQNFNLFVIYKMNKVLFTSLFICALRCTGMPAF